MENATLAQGNQVLNLILRKKVPAEQLKELIESGLLADLLDANTREINRESFSKIIGLRFKADQPIKKWKLLKDRRFDGMPFIPCTLAEGNFLNLKTMERYEGRLGQAHAEYLVDHQTLIPDEWHRSVLLFPGTIWLDGADQYNIPYLNRKYFFKGYSEWRLYFWTIYGKGFYGKIVGAK